MEVYRGPFLHITHNKSIDCFIQLWVNTQALTLEHFKSEMLVYTRNYEVLKPKHTLWDQTNFPLQLSTEDFAWIEEHVNIPCFEYGNKKCAFLVGEDVLSHITVMESFEQVQSCIKPKHFCSKEEALLWIAEDVEIADDSLEIKFSGTDSDGRHIFKISGGSGATPKILKNFKQISDDTKFYQDHQDKFNALTDRQKEILRLYCEGKTIKEIAAEVDISVLTTRTHWRNIKRKLQLSQSSEAQEFYRIFMS